MNTKTSTPTNSKKPAIALTGAAGYIASHIAVELLDAGYTIVGLDNFANSNPAVVPRVEEITGKPFKVIKADVRDQHAVTEILQTHNVNTVIHLAGLKAVGESVAEPLRYYDNNVNGSIALLAAMNATNTNQLVFSSSATVYSPDTNQAADENAPLGPTNPYGRTKMMVEQIIEDFCQSTNMRAINLRYFNPVGAHESGKIGEDPTGPPNNLMPFIMQVAAGRREKLRVFGNDYPTADGTPIRDYIHVTDLALGHLAAIEALEPNKAETPQNTHTTTAQTNKKCEAINLGTGAGSSVFEVLHAAEKAVGKPIPYEIAARRAGDAVTSTANPIYAQARLKWSASRNLEQACVDHWRWQRENPNGYNS